SGSGTGIGLLAVKRLVQRLGGSITLDSSVGKGATFIVRVPIQSEARITHDDHPSPRALLVEDDVLDARAIERLIGDEFVVIRAQDLEEAASRMESERFDVVLLDLSLPDGHGLQLLQRMTMKLDHRIPTVVITGHGEGLATDESDPLIGAFVSKHALDRKTLRDAIGKAIGRDESKGTIRTLEGD
ncbi:MAG: response regulator, partial [Phycisphaerales bacterium]|nr:response regulator [Phycisphaerales bacterium]